MTLGRNDLAATVLTGLAVLVFAATHEGWNVWLVGDSHRWAAGAILLLGVRACSLGAAPKGGGDRTWIALAVLGTLALGLAALAIATGSLTALSFLVLALVALWAVSTARHALRHTRTPLPQ